MCVGPKYGATEYKRTLQRGNGCPLIGIRDQLAMGWPYIMVSPIQGCPALDSTAHMEWSNTRVSPIQGGPT